LCEFESTDQLAALDTWARRVLHVETHAGRGRLRPGFMRLVKDRVLPAWREIKTEAKQRIAEIERKQKRVRTH
jgi:hypothetical protein